MQARSSQRMQQLQTDARKLCWRLRLAALLLPAMCAFGFSGALLADTPALQFDPGQTLRTHLAMSNLNDTPTDCFQAQLYAADGRALNRLLVERSSSGLWLASAGRLSENPARLLLRNQCDGSSSEFTMRTSAQTRVALPENGNAVPGENSRAASREARLAQTAARWKAMEDATHGTAGAPASNTDNPPPATDHSKTEPPPAAAAATALASKPAAANNAASLTGLLPAANAQEIPARSPVQQENLQAMEQQLRLLENRIAALHASRGPQQWLGQQQWSLLLSGLLVLTLGSLCWLLLHLRSLEKQASARRQPQRMSDQMDSERQVRHTRPLAQDSAPRNSRLLPPHTLSPQPHNSLQPSPVLMPAHGFAEELDIDEDFNLDPDDIPLLQEEAGQDVQWQPQDQLHEEVLFDAESSPEITDIQFLATTRMQVEEMHDSLTEARFWHSLQRADVAIRILLEETANNKRAASWLHLLKLYRETGAREEYEAMRAEFHRIFNGQIPAWEDQELGLMQRVADLPHIMQGLRQHMQQQRKQALAYLERLLLDDRDGTRQGFAYSVYCELVEMHESLRSGERLQLA